MFLFFIADTVERLSKASVVYQSIPQNISVNILWLNTSDLNLEKAVGHAIRMQDIVLNSVLAHGRA